MYYLKCLFFNFLAIFFANHILPGIVVTNQTKLPHLGGDIPFAAVLAILNSLIYPLLKLLDSHLSPVRIAMAAIILNFIVYALLKVIPVGIKITTIEGYLIPAAVVSVASFLTNYFEMRRNKSSGSGLPTSFGSIDQPKM